MKRILFSRTDSIGDVILTLPLVAEFKKKFPEVEVWFLAAPYTIPVLECCSAIDKIVDWKMLTDAPKPMQVQRLRELEIDTIVHVFPNKEIARLAKNAKIPMRIGTSHRVFHVLTCNEKVNFTRRKSDFHEAQLNFHLMRNTGFPTLPSWEMLNADLSYFKPAQHVEVAELQPHKKQVILHAKSQGSAVEWPIEKYAILAEELERLDVRVFFTGTEKEGVSFRGAISWSDNIVDTSGRFTLSELISFVDQCDMLVACSTGPLHIAGIRNKHVIGLFTAKRPLHPGRWRPLGENSVALTSRPVCTCKSKERCTCLEDISVELVLNQIKEKLSL